MNIFKPFLDFGLKTGGLTENELAFLNLPLEKGEIDSTLFIDDPDLQQRIQEQRFYPYLCISRKLH
jgi:hypothetical protein